MAFHFAKLNIMDGSEAKGNWEEQKSRLKVKFAELTDNDFLFVKGKKEEILSKLQVKLGKTREELNKILGAL